MKRLLVLSACAAIALFAVPALAATRGVKIGDDYFVRPGSPPTVTVSKGTIVKWVWRGRVIHNLKVTGPQHFIATPRVKGSFKHRMTKRGNYVIVCTIHPGMQMKLHVK